MKISTRIIALLLLTSYSLLAQTSDTIVASATSQAKPAKKRYVYFAWGYNRDFYSTSTIHFKSGSNSNFDYDFKWVDAKAHDYPGFNNIASIEISVPQYVYRLGYMINVDKGVGIEYAFDHAKYVVTQEQTFHQVGMINGEYQDTLITYHIDSMHFEHTNGANFAMLNVFKEKIFYATKSKKFEVAYIAKAGAGIVIPKTDVTLFSERLDNRFHVAGYIFGVEGGVTLNFWHNLYLSPTIKGVWANYANSLTVDNGVAQHSFWAYEIIATVGYKYRF